MPPLTVQPTVLAGAIAISTAMLDAARRVHRFAAARTPVVFMGETGTGKLFLASARHAPFGGLLRWCGGAGWRAGTTPKERAY